MRYLQVGFGRIGRKRKGILGDRCVATVDPAAQDADVPTTDDVDPADYDAAILSVPHDAKIPLAARFLARGVHVLIDKPLLFRTREEADRLGELAAARRLACVTSYNHRFEPGIQALRARLERGDLGTFYHGTLHYGNGTAGEIAGTWRDAGLGVVADLASHLLDLDRFLFGETSRVYRAVLAERRELAACDHAVLLSEDRRMRIECSFLDWKNRFAIDLFGEKGSLHVDGLQKWEGCTLIHRTRILPSGPPPEERSHFTGEDRSWETDLDAFERAAAEGRTTIEKDWAISLQLSPLESAVR